VDDNFKIIYFIKYMGGCGKLHNEAPQSFYSSPNTVRIIKSRRMAWAGHEYRFLGGKPEVKRPLARSRHKWENNTKRDVREIEWGEMG
jgi:hypothetical protein